MRPHASPTLVRLCLLLLVAAQAVAARGLDTDLPGARDPEGLARFAGSVIIGYRADGSETTHLPAGPWVAGRSKGSWKKSVEVSGRRTRILYLIPRTVRSQDVMRHYRDVLERAGYEMLYRCEGDSECGESVGGFYSDAGQDERLTDTYLLERAFSDGSVKDPWILVARRGSDSADQHLFLFGAYQDNYADSGAGERVAVFLERIEEGAGGSAPPGALIESRELSRLIEEEGHAALHAIGFEPGRATLMPESGPQIEAMARMLGETPDLSVYIVGHTDGQGDLEGNLDLSRRRATEVVQRLILNYGVLGERLTPRGVGNLAPVATNATPQGRALNARIEMVPR
ncbi:OmpA family protein [Imhoffiella purpurea]|uniref:OmpA-like domain-containing protein n=1 Tax=Imhoffiella purpurea TaxID=1249627 RepID=W9VDP6_9GAMM|nr:OmpA family protein [Imhoffiella purpurea]EXJ15116.1 hypothetical protein D779_1670 [Imhoffiella purpurea]